MTQITTRHLEGCVSRLAWALDQLRQLDSGEVTYEMFERACVKEFEVIVGLSTTLLRRRLVPMLMPDYQVEGLSHKDVFIHTARHGLISAPQCERWSRYWDLRHDRAHRWVEDFEKNTLPWLPQFIDDARDLVEVLE